MLLVVLLLIIVIICHIYSVLLLFLFFLLSFSLLSIFLLQQLGFNYSHFFLSCSRSLLKQRRQNYCIFISFSPSEYTYISFTYRNKFKLPKSSSPELFLICCCPGHFRRRVSMWHVLPCCLLRVFG